MILLVVLWPCGPDVMCASRKKQKGERKYIGNGEMNIWW